MDSIDGFWEDELGPKPSSKRALTALSTIHSLNFDETWQNAVRSLWKFLKPLSRPECDRSKKRSEKAIFWANLQKMNIENSFRTQFRAQFPSDFFEIW